MAGQDPPYATAATRWITSARIAAATGCGVRDRSARTRRAGFNPPLPRSSNRSWRVKTRPTRLQRRDGLRLPQLRRRAGAPAATEAPGFVGRFQPAVAEFIKRWRVKTRPTRLQRRDGLRLPDLRRRTSGASASATRGRVTSRFGRGSTRISTDQEAFIAPSAWICIYPRQKTQLSAPPATALASCIRVRESRASRWVM
jgi:hypothetical protein